MQLAGRALAGRQVKVLYTIQSDLGTVSMYDAISRDAVSLLVCRPAASVGNVVGFSSLLEFMHLPTNPEHKLLHFPHNKCDVTRLSAIPNSRCLVAVAPFSFPLLPPHGPTQNAGGPRIDIAPHPGRYVSDHKQAGGGKSMLISRLFAAAKCYATWYQHRALYMMMLRMYRDVVRCMV